MSKEFVCPECDHTEYSEGHVLTRNAKREYPDGSKSRVIEMFRNDVCLKCHATLKFLISSRKACKGCN